MGEQFHPMMSDPDDFEIDYSAKIESHNYDPFDSNYFSEESKMLFHQWVEMFSTVRNPKCDLIWDKLKSKVRKTEWHLFDNSCLLRNEQYVCVVGVLPHMHPTYTSRRYEFEMLLSKHCRSGYMEIIFIPLNSLDSVQTQMAEYEKSPPEPDEDLEYLRIQYSQPGTEEFFLKKTKYYDPVNGWVKSHEERPHVRLRLTLDDIPF